MQVGTYYVIFIRMSYMVWGCVKIRMSLFSFILNSKKAAEPEPVSLSRLPVAKGELTRLSKMSWGVNRAITL